MPEQDSIEWPDAFDEPEESEEPEEKKEQEELVDTGLVPEEELEEQAVAEAVNAPTAAEKAGMVAGTIAYKTGDLAKKGIEGIGHAIIAQSAPSPTQEANGDDLSDLFTAPKDTDPDMRVDDLVSVDIEADILDGDLSDLMVVEREKAIEEEDLSDLMEVSDADIMGDDDEDEEEVDSDDVTPGVPAAQLPPARYQLTTKGRRANGRQYDNPAGMQGVV